MNEAGSMNEERGGNQDGGLRPLAGLSVIDLSQVLAGPLCTMILGDLGADVIKVEPPQGDQSRQSLGTRVGSDSVAFLAVNRNKRSIVLDLHTDPGRRAMHRLVAKADIVVENFRPGVAERLGAGYDELSELNPRLIYGSLTGFGSSGPYAARAGLDMVVQAMTGLMSVTGEEGGRPVKLGPPAADLSSGLYLTVGILAALESRRKTGRGQLVTTSLYEAALSLAVWETAELWANGQTPGPLGSAHRMAAPYQALRTSDGYVVVAATNPRLWGRLCELVGLPHLVDDPRFLTNADRLVHRQELAALLEDALAHRTTNEWVDELVAAGVPGGPLHDYAQTLADPHTQATGMIVETEHPAAGRIRMLGSPVHLADSTFTVRRPPPLLGEHTAEVLAALPGDQTQDQPQIPR
jgi:crotonobetainyl-CoA:carnitine CoA-transferase CaiB-like acyl-CoA transferase